MKARKVTTTISIETLHVDSVYALLIEVAKNITDERVNGAFTMEDGDNAIWKCDYREVEF